MYRVSAFLVLLAALPLAACDIASSRDPARPTGTGKRIAGRLGPVRYHFDNAHLTLAEVMLALPPSYVEQLYAVKLIPAGRAALLGSPGCTYDGSLVQETCNARDEAGLAMVLLERPIGDYRAAFEAANAGDIELFDTRMDGIDGFAFRARPEDGGREYRFLPLGERTFLMARRPGPLAEADKAALEETIASLDLGG